MNPLTAIPPKFRKYAYAIFTLVALGVAAYQASNGDWVQFTALLLGSLGFGTAASNVTPDDEDDSEYTHEDDLPYEDA